MQDVTQILKSLEAGDVAATDQLLPIVYAELQRLARHKLSHEAAGQTLTATALVHEAYLRLVGEAASSSGIIGDIFSQPPRNRCGEF